jgi:hypothetical protein
MAEAPARGRSSSPVEAIRNWHHNSMDWVQETGERLPVTRLDDAMRVVSMSPAALRLSGVTLEQARGRTLSELAQREEVLAVLPPQWRRSVISDTHPVGGMLEEAARLYGNAAAWIWMMTPKGRLYRSIINMVKLESGFLSYVVNVEDSFSCTMVRADQNGTMVDSDGTEWTFQTIALFEDFIRGNSLQQISADHAIPPSRVRSILDDLAISKGLKTAGALRNSAYRSYAEELIPARHAIFPVMSDELPGFPLDDTPTS